MIIDRIKSALDSWSPVPAHASLFGSFARGQATTESDIDLLVVTGPRANPDVITQAVDRLAADIRKWTGNNAQIVDRKPEELAAMIASDDPLVGSWRADHIDIMGTRLLDLLRDLQRAS